MTLTPIEQERAMAWCERRRATDVRLRYQFFTYPDIDPDEEPYGDLATYHHPRHRWPLWKRTARALYLTLKGLTDGPRRAPGRDSGR